MDSHPTDEIENDGDQAPSAALPANPPPPYTSTTVAPLAGLAVVSLIFGILSLMSALLVVPAICAVITGHLAIHKIRHSRTEFGGHKLALTGMIMGYVSILMFSLIMVTAFLMWPKIGPVLREKIAEHKTGQSMRHASELYLLCERYARDHKDTYPPNWDELRKGYSNDIDLGKWLTSVHTDDPAYQPAFILVQHERPVFGSAKDRVAVLQERAPPKVPEVVVVFADGHSELMSNPEQ